MAGLEDFIRDAFEEGELAGGDEKLEKQRPAFRVMQPDTDRDGKKTLREVGAVWKNQSKAGRPFYVLKIGALRLLLFPAGGT